MRIKASILALALIGAPLGLQAVGLGKINVLSGLGQPLRAEVQIAATPDELTGVNARLASPEAFKQAGIEYAPSLRGLAMSVERRGDGAVLRISSDRPLNDPFVDLLIELNWASGRLLREYTFLLDPSDAASASAAVAVAPPAEPRSEKAQPPARMVAREQKRPVPERPAAAEEKAEAPARQEAKREADAYLVKPGDTLRSIAQQHQPEGASLDQMLVALYRSNRTAFVGGNINRLMAGKLLSLPDDAAVKSVPPAEAHKRVVANSADFAGYRRKLASDVQATPARETETSRRSGGKIAARVTETGPAANQPQDQLKVSRTGMDAADSRQAPGQPVSPDRLKALEEDRLAKDKALKDANERLAELEKNIQQLQGLIELKNRTLAEAQQAGAAPQQPAAPVDAPKPAVQAEAPKPVVAPPPLKVEAQKEVEHEEPAASGLLDNPAVLAGSGGILALLLGWAGFAAYRRRKAAQVEPETPEPPVLADEVQEVHGTGGQSIDTGASAPAIQADFSQAGLGSIDADEGVDPVAEADVYIAYGRDAQAEEILLDALKAEPVRPAVLLKLLEIYAHRGSVEPFNKFAADLQGITGGQGAEWEAAAALGRKLDPANPRYGEDGQTAPAAEKAALADEGIDFHLTGVDLPDISSSSQLYGQPSGRTAPAAAAQPQAQPEVRPQPVAAMVQEEVSEPSLEISNGLDFDLDLPLDDEPAVAPLEEPKKPANVAMDTGGLDFELDFALPESGSHAEEVQLDDTVVAPELSSRGLLAGGADSSWDEAGGVDLDFDPEAGKMHTEFAGGAEEGDFDIAATRLEPMSDSQPSEDADDMEKTRLESNFLDFDFDPDEAAAPAAVEQAASAPDFDLSGLDLDLDLDLHAPEAHKEPGGEQAGESGHEDEIVEFVPDPAQDPFAEFAPRPDSEEAPAAPAEPEIDPLVLQEVATKLELARAYEEMGDREGARELLDEALRDGSIAQQDEARKIIARL